MRTSGALWGALARARGAPVGTVAAAARCIPSPKRWAQRRSSSSSSSGSGRGWTRSDYLQKILSARVYDVAIETPLQPAPLTSARLGANVLLKREDLQPVFSFKIRGAYNAIASLSDAQKAAGIVACSAGNHAQGVVYSALRLNLDAIICMPLATPKIKVDAVRALGGKVELVGQTFDDCSARAAELVERDGRTMVHPFNDPLVIAGQGTVAMEVLKQLNGKALDAIFVCCGGGGLLAGISAYVKAVRPDVKVIGVEAADAAGMTESLRQDRVVTLPTVGLFADGAAVATVGDETFRLCREHVDEMVTVSTDEICAAIKQGFNDTRSVLEPAGALAIAGVGKYVREVHGGDAEGRTFVVTTSGANMDFDRLRFVSERADATETLISVRIPERPGAFKELYGHIAPRNVTEFSYRHSDPSQALIFLSFQHRNLPGEPPGADADAVLRSISESGFEVSNLMGNELAKAHGRYMCGGHTQPSSNLSEVLYRFEFPERPGALQRFLDKLTDGGFNVTLFHYRNHGADVGRVLVGAHVSDAETAGWEQFLSEVGYPFFKETENQVYEQYLK